MWLLGLFSLFSPLFFLIFLLFPITLVILIPKCPRLQTFLIVFSYINRIQEIWVFKDRSSWIPGRSQSHYASEGPCNPSPSTSRVPDYRCFTLLSVCNAGDWTWGFVHEGQALSQLKCVPSSVNDCLNELLIHFTENAGNLVSSRILSVYHPFVLKVDISCSQ